MCCGGVVNEAGLPGLTLATVVFVWAASAGMNQWEGSHLFYPFCRRFGQKTKHSNKKKGFFWSGEKGLNPRNWTKGTQRWLSFSPSVPPFFFRVPGGREHAVGCIFVLLCAHFMLRSPAERGYAACTERPCWNAYNALWKLWLLLNLNGFRCAFWRYTVRNSWLLWRWYAQKSVAASI